MATNFGMEPDNSSTDPDRLLKFYRANFNQVMAMTHEQTEQIKTLLGTVNGLQKQVNILKNLYKTTRDELRAVEAENKTKMISEVQTEPEQSAEGDQELDNSQSDKKIQEQQDPHPSVVQLKERQDKILRHLQNHSDDRDSKTLVLNKIGMKHIAMHIYNNKVTNIWPIMEYQLARRGLSFLLQGCTDIKIFRNGSVRIRYDAQFRIRKSIFDLKWFLYNLKKCQKYPNFVEIWKLTKSLTFSILTPSRFQAQRSELQKIANFHKNNLSWGSFEFLLMKDSAGEKSLVLRGFLKDKSGQYVDIKT